MRKIEDMGQIEKIAGKFFYSWGMYVFTYIKKYGNSLIIIIERVGRECGSRSRNIHF